jgi:hypothetical protein
MEFFNSHAWLRQLWTASRCARCDSAAFVHDSYRVVAGIQPVAFVRNELFLDVGVCILGSAYGLWICRELGTATFTHAKHRNIILSFDDPKLAFRSFFHSHA